MTPLASARFAGRPLALALRAFDRLAVAATADPALLERASTPTYAVTDDGIAVVPVLGLLVGRGDWLSALFGATSTADLGDALAEAFIDPAVRAVLMEVDSPGGEVGGLFDLTDRIGALKTDTGKPLWAVASETALSAAYAIASTADRLYVTRTGEVGSIGVVAAHVDESGADAKAGLTWTLIQAGARKTDGNPHQPLSPPAVAAVQADVDALYADFVDLVARNRSLPAAAVRATDAATYRGSRGVAAGLADAVGTIPQALADLGSVLATPSRSFIPQFRRPLPMSAEADPYAVEPVPPPVPPPSQPEPSPVVSPPIIPPPDPAEALRAEYAEIADVATQAARLGVTVDAADAMRKGIKPEALRRTVLDTLAARADAITMVTTAPAGSSGDSPIVRRARERAAAVRS